MTPTDLNIAAQVQAYWQGSLNRQQMHELELAALSDPFLADALEGYRTVNSNTSEQHVRNINRKLADRQNLPAPLTVAWKRWTAVAAAAAVLGLATVVFWPTEKAKQPLAQQQKMAPSLDTAFEESAINQAPTLADTTANVVQSPKPTTPSLAAKPKAQTVEPSQPSALAAASAPAAPQLPERMADDPRQSRMAAADNTFRQNVDSNLASGEAAFNPDMQAYPPSQQSSPALKEAKAKMLGQGRAGATILLQRLQGIDVEAQTQAKTGLSAVRYRMGNTSILLQATRSSEAQAVAAMEEQLRQRLMLERLARPLPTDSGIIYLKIK